MSCCPPRPLSIRFARATQLPPYEGLTRRAEAHGADPGKTPAQNLAAFTAALTALSAIAVSGIVTWSGTLPMAPGLSVPSGFGLRGDGCTSALDYSQTTGEADGIVCAGSIGTGVALAANAAEGDTDLNVSGSGFADGDWVMVYSDAVTGSTNIPKGEICRIETASTMVLVDPLQDSYTTATNAKVAKITFVRDVRFENFKIIGPTDDSSTFAGIVCDRVLNAQFSGITTERCWYTGIELKDTVFFDVAHCQFSDSGNSGLNYGVAVVQASQDGTLSNLRGYRLRHLVTHGGSSSRNGIPRRIITGTSVASQCYQSGFDAHAGCEDITFADCTSLGSLNEGITIECASATVIGCTVRDAAVRGISLRTHSVKPFNVRVLGNHVFGKRNATTKNGIWLEVNASFETFDTVQIENNSVEDCQFGFLIDNTQTGRVTGLSVSRNHFKRCGATGTDTAVYIKHAERVKCDGNTIEQAVDGLDGIAFDDVTGGSSCSGNNISLPNGATCRCIRMLTTTSRVTIDGNVCSGGASSVGIALADTASNVTVGPTNDVSGCATGYAFGTGSGHALLQKVGLGADVGNAGKTLDFVDLPTQLWNTPLTAARTVTLPAGNVKARWRVVRGASATGAFNLNVGTGPLKALATAGTWCDVESNGTAYVLVANGTL